MELCSTCILVVPPFIGCPAASVSSIAVPSCTHTLYMTAGGGWHGGLPVSRSMATVCGLSGLSDRGRGLLVLLWIGMQVILQCLGPFRGSMHTGPSGLVFAASFNVGYLLVLTSLVSAGPGLWFAAQDWHAVLSNAIRAWILLFPLGLIGILLERLNSPAGYGSTHIILHNGGDGLRITAFSRYTRRNQTLCISLMPSSDWDNTMYVDNSGAAWHGIQSSDLVRGSMLGLPSIRLYCRFVAEHIGARCCR